MSEQANKQRNSENPTFNIELDRFALQAHSDEYASWSAYSPLIIDGVLSTTKIRGYQLLHQFDTPLGFLLITDEDCPYEEATSFTLLDRHSFKRLSERTLAVPYGSFSLEDIAWLDHYRARLRFWQDDYFLLRLLPAKGFFRWRAGMVLRREAT